MRSRLIIAIMLSLVGAASSDAQNRFPRDTVSPRYARFRDELPEFFGAIAAVVDTGFRPALRDYLTREFETLRPPPTWTPRMQVRSRSYLVTTQFQGREAMLRVFVYWNDTSVVAMRLHGTDSLLIDAIDSVLLERRVAKLVVPASIGFSVRESDPYNGSEESFSYAFKGPATPQCPGYGFDRRMRTFGDTMLVQVLGLPKPGMCPNVAGLRGESYWTARPPGHYHVIFDARGDSNLVDIDVTDTSVVLRPVRTTYVIADTTVVWRYPPRFLLLTCNREVGDPRLCDAVHEFVAAQPTVRTYRFPAGGLAPAGASSTSMLQELYRYDDDSAAARIRRCITLIPVQTRLDSWVRIKGRPAVGKWWAESPPTNGIPPQRTAAVLDAYGKLPSACGDRGFAFFASDTLPKGQHVKSSVTRISTFAYQPTNATSVEARDDGWITLTPLRQSPFDRARTNHVFARADDALSWVERVRAVLSLRGGSESQRYIPRLGRGRVYFATAVTDSAGASRVRFTLNDCGRGGRQYNVDAPALREISTYVREAANMARRLSPTPVSPSRDHAYSADDVSCPVLLMGDSSVTGLLRALELDVLAALVEFTVDTAGRVDPSSVVVVPARPLSVARSIRSAITQWRYRPAELAGVPVRQRVRLELTAGGWHETP